MEGGREKRSKYTRHPASAWVLATLQQSILFLSQPFCGDPGHASGAHQLTPALSFTCQENYSG